MILIGCVLWIWTIGTLLASCYGIRSCFVCSGETCRTTPQDKSLYPGMVACHEVMEYCTVHARYLVKNSSLVKVTHLNQDDYEIQSVTRSCAKIWMGNTCRRDWRGTAHITCISTCSEDYCNCDVRSPPPEMFPGEVLYLAPERSTYSPEDMNSCHRSEHAGDNLNAIDKRKKHAKRLKNQDRRKYSRGKARNVGSGIAQRGLALQNIIFILLLNSFG